MIPLTVAAQVIEKMRLEQEALLAQFVSQVRALRMSACGGG
jgi:hypothetical protein